MPVVGFQSKRYASHFFGKRNMFFFTVYQQSSNVSWQIAWVAPWWGGQRWQSMGRVEKCREEGKRVWLWWGEMEQLWLLTEKSCKNWEELRWPEKSWESLVTIEKRWGNITTNSENRVAVAKLWGFASFPIVTFLTLCIHIATFVYVHIYFM